VKSRPLENTSLLPIAATMALEMIGPTTGTVIRRAHARSLPDARPVQDESMGSDRATSGTATYGTRCGTGDAVRHPYPDFRPLCGLTRGVVVTVF
jgi:hypothetical protein